MSSGSPTSNMGSSSEMIVRCCSTGSIFHSLLKFDLRQLNSGNLTGIVITSVELRLFMHDGPDSSRTYGAFSSTNTTWTEGSVTYTNFGGAATFNSLPQLVTTTAGTSNNVFVSWTGSSLTTYFQNAT
ncbi:MAG TPA: DNRLRE domain-containing protein [Gemmatimonadales bacterium]|nr:DNRLRE domain-containing protein [Gemmatimonadales bacterium]